MTTELSYENYYHIRTYEIDNHKRLTIPALMRLMQETTMQHVIRLRLSVWDLEKQHLSWVLMRKQIVVQQMPILGQHIRIQTYPAGIEKLFTYRDYKVFDEKGDLVVYATSTWMLMDTENRRMVNTTEVLRHYLDLMPPSNACLPKFEGGKLAILPNYEHHCGFQVNWHDLDFNLHLNNTCYAQWMLDALPGEHLNSQPLQRMDIYYRKECVLKEELTSQAGWESPGVCQHRLVRLRDGVEVAAGRSYWVGGFKEG
ncbi:MAG TPA: thioesterase [Saprospiraceae bacterium]|nr:thioesterase [Saprospiraceae bacterium]HMQ83213.1 thioesterase [Saprospiraceae bacterium]